MGTPISEIVGIVRDKINGKKSVDVDEVDDIDEEEEDDVEAPTHGRSRRSRKENMASGSGMSALIKQFIITGMVSAGTLGIILTSDSLKLLNADTGKINLISILLVASIISGLTILISKFL